ncbi:putative methionyl-tRNA synthetase [Hordeum vulgare]|nr:putative methionyl-tRNA synthetase [Hordeum vulgare]
MERTHGGREGGHDDVKKDMDEDQLMWWKEYKQDIAERKRIFRGASSTLRSDTPMSGGGDGGVEDSATGDNGG